MTENNLERYLKEKSNTHLTENFDNDMMFMIKKHVLNKSKEKKYLKLMYLFFFIGLLLGFTVAITFVDMVFLIGNNKILVNKIFLQIPLIVIVLFLFEKIYKATLVSIGKERFHSV